MKNLDADTILQLTKKLEIQNDISLEEADQLFSLMSPHNDFVDEAANYKIDYELVDALKGWYCAAADKIKNGHRGNFVFTIRFNNHGFVDWNLWYTIQSPAIDAIMRYGGAEDLCKVFVVDKKMYVSFSSYLQGLFRLNQRFEERGGVSIKHIGRDNDTGGFYKLKTNRAGLLLYPVETHTISEIMKPLRPAAVMWLSNSLITYNRFFEMASMGGIPETRIVSGGGVKQHILAAFISRKNIPYIVAIDAKNKSVLFTEEQYIPIIKKAKEIPFEDLVNDAVDKSIINTRMAKNLLDNNHIKDFPIKKFVENSMKIMYDIIKLKTEWESTRKSVENEKIWLEEIR